MCSVTQGTAHNIALVSGGVLHICLAKCLQHHSCKSSSTLVTAHIYRVVQYEREHLGSILAAVPADGLTSLAETLAKRLLFQQLCAKKRFHYHAKSSYNRLSRIHIGYSVSHWSPYIDAHFCAICGRSSTFQ